MSLSLLSIFLALDAIMVIDKGQIIQQGTHNELISKEGYYKALYKKQLQESTRWFHQHIT